ncbi:cytochrome c nitrite reductase small subunit [Candidatus Sulfurimonas baltica]|uniref:Cytochrome c nitrite reductase small subunit n=1 Tax=Candidatus Sulfurimonas baltica TaxID=2740404 RepID=A0A7S7LW75_9BACT|nr:cytochrome c nitrite reductase small subunit [Candidatus Sulfurimonas baltica]QOY52462.1 cytochrome c nitrite reductase small subunit [Candidatus Sulfurimonas baltica]
MKKNVVIMYGSILTFLIAIGFFVYTLDASKALSYLSSDPRACVNCHTMNSAYATWSRSSHKDVATCVDCHLPVGDAVKKYAAKAKDGWNHSVAMTLKSYGNNLTISEDGANRVQENCIRCHSNLTSVMAVNAIRGHSNSNKSLKNERKCWECHKYTPHGKVRSLTSTPYNLGVKEKIK